MIFLIRYFGARPESVGMVLKVAGLFAVVMGACGLCSYGALLAAQAMVAP